MRRVQLITQCCSHASSCILPSFSNGLAHVQVLDALDVVCACQVLSMHTEHLFFLHRAWYCFPYLLLHCLLQLGDLADALEDAGLVEGQVRVPCCVLCAVTPKAMAAPADEQLLGPWSSGMNLPWGEVVGSIPAGPQHGWSLPLVCKQDFKKHLPHVSHDAWRF